MVRGNLPFVVTNQSLDDNGNIASILDALGDRSRRSIVECLRDQPHAVTELADRLPISRPAISQHLKVLSNSGLVTHRAAGTRNIYALDPEVLEILRAYLDVVWRDGLDSFAQLTQEEP